MEVRRSLHMCYASQTSWTETEGNTLRDLESAQRWGCWAFSVISSLKNSGDWESALWKWANDILKFGKGINVLCIEKGKLCLPLNHSMIRYFTETMWWPVGPSVDSSISTCENSVCPFWTVFIPRCDRPVGNNSLHVISQLFYIVLFCRSVLHCP